MESKNIVNSVLGLLGFCTAVTAASFIKMNYIVGSQAAHFSAATAIVPLAGVQGILFGTAALLVNILGKIFLGSSPFTYLLYHIPSLCGALFWSGRRLFAGVIIPLICVVLFIAHPQGGGASVYTLYWLIPVVLVLTKSRNLFAWALSCSFIMHAVGSVIWLYAVQIPTAVWLGLIPVVFVERLLLAAAMMSSFIIMQEIKRLYFSRTFAGKKINIFAKKTVLHK